MALTVGGVEDVQVGDEVHHDEMEWLLRDIAQSGEAITAEEADSRPVPSFEAAP